jgi:hypothetical protein
MEVQGDLRDPDAARRLIGPGATVVNFAYASDAGVHVGLHGEYPHGWLRASAPLGSRLAGGRVLEIVDTSGHSCEKHRPASPVKCPAPQLAG